MRAYIELNDDPTTIADITVFEEGFLQERTAWVHRPLPWTIEDIVPEFLYEEP